MALRFHAFLREAGSGVRDGSLISKRIYMIFNTDYRSDPDLEFLASISSDMLLPLIDAIFYSDKEKRVRFSADDDALNNVSLIRSVVGLVSMPSIVFKGRLLAVPAIILIFFGSPYFQKIYYALSFLVLLF